jgi:hypothetical protein
MKPFVRIGLAIVLGSAVACGQSAEQKQAEEVQKQAEQAEKSADQLTKGAEDIAKGLEAAARGMGAAITGDPDAKPVDPVDFKALQALLPAVDGWERTEPEAERMTIPVSFAYASTRYTKGDFEIREKITDSGFNQLLIAPLSMMIAAGYSKESNNGFEKSTTAGGHPGFEKWDRRDKSGELTLFVNKRFVVELEGSGMPDNKELHAFVERTDLKKLADLK